MMEVSTVLVFPALSVAVAISLYQPTEVNVLALVTTVVLSDFLITRPLVLMPDSFVGSEPEI